jgi:competence ComEA-like helix-hairpin-helix protein
LTSVLFITSNGIGMGHLTRVMAIARKLPEGLKPIIMTMSKGLPTARRQGFYTEYFPSKKVSSLDDREWRIGLETRVMEMIEEHQPSVVAFDGIYPYMGLRNALEAHPELTSIWIRRAMWSPGRGAEQLQYSDLFDVVLEPGEFAAERDAGLTVPLRDQAFTVAPITYCDESDLLSREEAEAALGLEPCRTRALIQIGEVPVRQRDFIMQTSASHILQHPETQVAILESAISEHLMLPSAVIKLAAVYPIARLYRAFDFVVSAAGYNSYHELISFQIPTAFLPVLKPTDFQAMRARYAEERGVGIEVGLDTTRAIEILMNEPERARMASRARELTYPNGAPEAAEEISRLASTGKRRRRRRRRRPEPGSGTSPTGADGRIKLRKATAEQLRAIKGVGPSTAEKIILLREQRGGLASVEELDAVSGIGPATMEALRGRLEP